MNKFISIIIITIILCSCNSKEKSIVYASDNPAERVVWERLRLMNPLTSQIPNNIRKKEMMFAKTLPKSTNLVKANWVH